MALYRVAFRRSAELELYAVPFPFRRQIAQRLMRLQNDARPTEAQHVAGNVYRLFIYGWHVTYVIDEDEAMIAIARVYR